MKRAIIVAALCASCATAGHAQTTGTATQSPVTTTSTSPIAAPQTSNAVLRAGTEIALAMSEEVTTKKKAAKVGQRIQLRVTAPVEVNGVVVIPVDSPAWGELTSVRNKGGWGKSGKLEARLLFVRVNGRQIRLSGTFDDKGTTGTAGVVGAIALVPIAGFLMTGTSAVLPLNGPVKGFIDEDVPLAMEAAPVSPLQVQAVEPMTLKAEAGAVVATEATDDE